MEYLQVAQEMFYQARVGTIYGCFRVEKVEYDWEKHWQVWTMRCIHCGFEKQTHNGKDYVKGKNKGTCRCQRVKRNVPVEIVEKQKKPYLKDHELYSRWKGMKARCNQKGDKDYHNYGARGIKVCDEWGHDFMAFVEWAYANGYEKGLTIERIDNDKGYSPENCRWISRGDQNKNKRNVKLYDGKTLPDICKENGVEQSTVISRLLKGMSIEDALRSGVTYGKIMPIVINGESKTLREWCEYYGLTTSAVRYRVKKLGMTYQEAITTPKRPGCKKN